jgi:HEAT repeat protein
MHRLPARSDFDGWVGQLARSQGRRQAKRHLMLAGPPALPAVRRGLRHPEAIVRRLCVGILDHLVDEESLPDLVAALDDEDPNVCGRALHALACDACKQQDFRPGDDLFVPRALELLRDHPDPDVRAAAIDALGKVAHRRAEVAAALEAAAREDAHPGIRNMARIRLRRVRVPSPAAD